MQVTGNNHLPDSILSIRLCTDGFSFSVHNRTGKAFFSFTPYTVNPTISLAANIKEAIRQTPFLSNSFAQVQILLDVPATYVPLECFDEEQTEALYTLNYPQDKGKNVLYNILPHNNAVALFALDKSAYQLLHEHFPQARYYAAETPVMEHLQDKSQRRETKKLFAYFHRNAVSAYAFGNGKLLFANTFHCAESDNALYYLLQVWKNTGMEQTQDELHLISLPEQFGNLQEELRRYIRQVYKVNPSAEFNRSEIARHPQVPYDLQCLLICGI